MLWLEGQENREESVLCCRYSVDVLILPYCPYLQSAPEFPAVCRCQHEGSGHVERLSPAVVHGQLSWVAFWHSLVAAWAGGQQLTKE